MEVPLRRNRDFVLLQAGQALSTIGSEASGLAYTLLVLALTNSPAKAGLAGFARLVPYALFALPAGVAVDRWNRKRLMIWSDIVRVVALASLGVSVASGRVTFSRNRRAGRSGWRPVVDRIDRGAAVPQAPVDADRAHSLGMAVARDRLVPGETERLRAHRRVAPFILFNPTVNAMIIGYRVAIVPDRLQGRVNSVARSLALLGLPLGPVVGGLLLGSFSARATVAFLLVGFALLAVLTTANRAIRAAPSFEEVAGAAAS